MAAKISVLGLILSSSPYLRSALGVWPLYIWCKTLRVQIVVKVEVFQNEHVDEDCHLYQRQTDRKTSRLGGCSFWLWTWVRSRRKFTLAPFPGAVIMQTELNDFYGQSRSSLRQSEPPFFYCFQPTTWSVISQQWVRVKIKYKLNFQ